MNAYGEAVTGERGRRGKKREERVRKGKGREKSKDGINGREEAGREGSEKGRKSSGVAPSAGYIMNYNRVGFDLFDSHFRTL